MRWLGSALSGEGSAMSGEDIDAALGEVTVTDTRYLSNVEFIKYVDRVVDAALAVSRNTPVSDTSDTDPSNRK